MSGERITAVLSTLIAIAILGAGVVAQPSRTPKAVPASDRAASLESDLRYQLELAYRHDRGAFRDRTAQLEQTLQAWHASPKSPADGQLLNEWLRESISRSLPNKLQPLPPTPSFGADAEPKPVEAVPAETSPPTASSASPKESPATTKKSPPTKASPAAAAVELAVKSEPSASVIAPIAAKPKNEQPTPPRAPALARNVVVEVEAIAAPTPIAAPPAPPAAAAKQPEPVSINLAELNARIGGYHDALDEVEAAVVAAGNGPSLALAMRLTRQIEQLAEQRRFAQLYFDSLTKRERLFVVKPRSMVETIELIETLVNSVDPPAADDDFLAATEETDPRDELLECLQAASEQP